MDPVFSSLLLFAREERPLLFSSQKYIRELALVDDTLPGGPIDWCMYIFIYFYLPYFSHFTHEQQKATIESMKLAPKIEMDDIIQVMLVIYPFSAYSPFNINEPLTEERVHIIPRTMFQIFLGKLFGMEWSGRGVIGWLFIGAYVRDAEERVGIFDI